MLDDVEVKLFINSAPNTYSKCQYFTLGNMSAVKKRT